VCRCCTAPDPDRRRPRPGRDRIGPAAPTPDNGRARRAAGRGVRADPVPLHPFPTPEPGRHTGAEYLGTPPNTLEQASTHPDNGTAPHCIICGCRLTTSALPAVQFEAAARSGEGHRDGDDPEERRATIRTTPNHLNPH
jgi:hypothetical protein